MVTSRPPDIILLILDTVRQSEAPGGADPVPGLPALERVVRESVSFAHAFAPAPWTVPSHVSLLTGLAPWEHGLHARGRTRLGADVPTIASELRPLGYRSVSLSSNPYLGDGYGISDGFDEAYWGGWHEPFLRGLPLKPRSRGGAAGRASPAGLSARQLTDSLATAVQRHPAGWDGLLRVGRRLPSGDVPEGAVSGWIEPTLEAFLARQSEDRPLFSLVNLMDAHEPYIGVPGVPTGFGTPRQDRAAWVRGHWSPDPRELTELRQAYRMTYHVLDRRLARLEALYRSHQRWENAVVIVTSDHGQAFGEHGILYRRTAHRRISSARPLDGPMARRVGCRPGAPRTGLAFVGARAGPGRRVPARPSVGPGRSSARTPRPDPNGHRGRALDRPGPGDPRGPPAGARSNLRRRV